MAEDTEAAVVFMEAQAVVFTVVEAVVFTEAAVVSEEVVRTAAAALVARVLTGEAPIEEVDSEGAEPTAEAHIEAVHSGEAGVTAEAHIGAAHLEAAHSEAPAAMRPVAGVPTDSGADSAADALPALAQPLRTADGIHLAVPEEASRMREPR